jgi:hypothetical protein
MKPSRIVQLVAAVLLTAMLAVPGCDNVERVGDVPRPGAADTGIVLDVPQIMRGTIASETVIRGYPQAGNWSYNNVVVRGYGLVIGLGENGSRDMAPDLRAHMLGEMSRMGGGSDRFGAGHISPQAMLDSTDTAVVIVEAVIPPGAVAGTRFDVRVYADPHSGTTSLEGGSLYTTDLYPEPGALQLGRGRGFALAEGRGPLFINPFSEPRADGRDTVNRTVARILNGGSVKDDMQMKLRLVNPSHTRASVIERAINGRFPQERGQRERTARGESEELIVITVPPSFHGRTDEFVAILQHTTIRSIRPEQVAMSVRSAVKRNPATAAAASLRWQALGVKVLPIIQDLYQYPEELPRLAALSAGAKLDDALATPELLRMAREGSVQSRIQAIELLAGMRTNPRIDAELRDLLNHSDPEVRLTSYEALAERADAYLDRYIIDGKFLLDVVESSLPMVYITQRAQPRIVVFGKSLAVSQPTLMSAWSERLMLNSRHLGEPIELYYRKTDALEGEIHSVDPNISKLVRFLGHSSSPERPQPGLGLSYAETVGALHQIWKANHMEGADFKAENDRILAAIVRQERQAETPDRANFSTPGSQEGGPPPAPGDSDTSLGGRN